MSSTDYHCCCCGRLQWCNYVIKSWTPSVCREHASLYAYVSVCVCVCVGTISYFMFNQKFTPSKSREKKESARHALWLLFLLFMCGGQCVQSAAAYEPSVEYHLSRIEPKKKTKVVSVDQSKLYWHVSFGYWLIKMTEIISVCRSKKPSGYRR